MEAISGNDQLKNIYLFYLFSFSRNLRKTKDFSRRNQVHSLNTKNFAPFGKGSTSLLHVTELGKQDRDYLQHDRIFQQIYTL